MHCIELSIDRIRVADDAGTPGRIIQERGPKAMLYVKKTVTTAGAGIPAQRLHYIKGSFDVAIGGKGAEEIVGDGYVVNG